MNPYLKLSTEVSTALAAGRAVVALESTIITHGMPWPQNVQTAEAVEETVREHGAVPATIAVMEGVIHVGLDRDQLQTLGKAADVMKLSRADLAACVALGATGSTTVAATMIVAHLAGIAVFATGGIGGVHQDVLQSQDISADLSELARTPVNVICAGAKAVLDIPRTLEVLETLGVPVATYQSTEFPAFWSRNSGIPSPLSFDTIATLAEFIQVRGALQLGGGVLIANPVPASDEIPTAEMSAFIETALQAASQRNISGKAVTPFLLDHIYQQTAGRSLAVNVALIKNNAAVARSIGQRAQLRK